jgi:hypothetical protein
MLVRLGEGKDSGVETRGGRSIGIRGGEERRSAKGTEFIGDGEEMRAARGVELLVGDDIVMQQMVRDVGGVGWFIWVDVTIARIGATERAIEWKGSKCHVSADYHMAMTSLVWDILEWSTICISDVTMTSSEQSGAVWSGSDVTMTSLE